MDRFISVNCAHYSLYTCILSKVKCDKSDFLNYILCILYVVCASLKYMKRYFFKYCEIK